MIVDPASWALNDYTAWHQSTKMRDKVKEHGAQEKGRQVQDNSQGSLGTHVGALRKTDEMKEVHWMSKPLL